MPLSFWKINHSFELEWVDDDGDSPIFVIIVHVKALELGFSTCCCSNTDSRKKIQSNRIGLSKISRQRLYGYCPAGLNFFYDP